MGLFTSGEVYQCDLNCVGLTYIGLRFYQDLQARRNWVWLRCGCERPEKRQGLQGNNISDSLGAST